MNFVRVFVRNMSHKKWEPLKGVGIIGVPFEKGQKKYGVSVAPAAMRSAGLIEHLKEIDGLNVVDYGDIETVSSKQSVAVNNMSHLPTVSACNEQLSERVSQVLRDGRIAVTIGGDHSIGVGTVDGHYKVNEDMILIWVDAHADINTNKTSESGSVHGMPVALLVKELSDYWPYLPTMDWQVPKFSIKNLGYVGLRSVDKYERLVIEKYNVPTFAMEDIEEFGIKNSINHILQTLDPCLNKPIHVSFDIDSLDALEAPSTGTPVRGGLTLREAINLMEIIYSTGRLRAIDLVEINPALGNDSDRKRTIEAGLAVLRAGLGFSRKGTAPRGILDLPIQTHHEEDYLSKAKQN
ncbi:arginase, hepatic [Galleria mellonella]|uniref:Arginase n=1 Tax=Galleria mellonella TaxID=7137 RepID=A0ABM3MR47_GALME|nr:arginase, hepatic [Galleria mellonella]